MKGAVKKKRGSHYSGAGGLKKCNKSRKNGTREGGKWAQKARNRPIKPFGNGQLLIRGHIIIIMITTASARACIASNPINYSGRQMATGCGTATLTSSHRKPCIFFGFMSAFFMTWQTAFFFSPPIPNEWNTTLANRREIYLHFWRPMQMIYGIMGRYYFF